MRRTLLVVAVVATIALAGCAGSGPTGDTSPAPTPTATVDDPADDDAPDGADAGTVAFYISDEENDIDDFAHLNATVTEVQFHYVGPVEDRPVTTEVAGTSVTPEVAETPVRSSVPATTTVVATTAETSTTDAPDTESDESDEGRAGDAGWITKDIDDTTVDLTKLQGANATLLENVSMPAGKYTQVRLVVGAVGGTLADGSDQRVKLPSDRLKLTKPFTLESGDSVDFVFDVTVHQAGNSGKYVLKPVAGESGTDQEIERVDARADGSN